VHVLYLAPEHPLPHRDFVRALKAVGARVSGIGHRPRQGLDPEIARLLDDYEGVRSLFDEAAVRAAGEAIARRTPLDRLEATDETLTLPAARLREALGVPGLSVRGAILCRDKTAMKEALRAGGIPCAASAAVSSPAAGFAFAEREGYPLIVKPRAGLGAQGTYRVENARELGQAMAALGLDREGAPGAISVAIEEFVEGHEGFHDTLTVDGEVRHEFISHYYPSVLVAMQNRWISPQIVATNRMDAPGYKQVKELGRKVIELLGIGTAATHMEWFFGPKGLKFSEIGARPPGERLWDLHCAGNEMDLYREWALAVTTGRTEARPSRRFAAGSVQVRPNMDGVYVGHEGLEAVRKLAEPWIFASSLPRPGTRTSPMRQGYLVNTWLRLKHPSYDVLCHLLNTISSTLKAVARPG